MVEYLLQSALRFTPLNEIARKLCYSTNEIVSFHRSLAKNDLPAYFKDLNIHMKDLRAFSFPDLLWSTVGYKHPSLYTYPLGDAIERSLKWTIAVLLFSDNRSIRNSNVTSNKDINVQQKLYVTSKSLTIDYLLKLFLTRLFFELCIAKLRSKTGKKVDLGYTYHFSNGCLVPLSDQMNLRSNLLDQCAQLAERFLPYLLNSLKQKTTPSMVLEISNGMKQVFLSRSAERDYDDKFNQSKPFINVIVGLKQKSELKSDYQLATDITRIILDGKYKNVTFDLDPVESFLGHSLHTLTKDLLEIGFVIYMSDIYTERNSDLSRRLSILMPVRHLDAWRRVQSQIERTISFLARDNVEIHFIKKREACDDIDAIGPSDDKKKCCCLLSGGLDSAIGAIWALQKELSPIFVSYSSGNLGGIQTDLIEMIEHKTNQTLPHLVIPWNKSKRRSGPYRLGEQPDSVLKQHLRSFFYVSLATAIAIESKCNTVYVFENGPVALNPLLSESHVNTRTVHPQFLDYFRSVINSVFGINIEIKNPFLYRTKGELVRYLVNKKLAKDVIPLTSSCFNYSRVKAYAKQWFSIVGYKGRHDGDCLPCIFRRVSLHNANVPSRYDDYLIDVFNIFDSPIFLRLPEHSLDTIIRIADLLRFCQCVSNIPMPELIVEFPDLSLYSTNVDSKKLIDMYGRHCEEVIQCFRDKSSRKFQETFRTVLTP